MLVVARAESQELQPRAFSASPVGANFLLVAYSYSDGALYFGPSVPVTNAHGYVSGTKLGFGRTFAIGGVQSLVSVAVPHYWSRLTGTLGGADTGDSRSGWGDLSATLSVNFVGSPALSRGAFAQRPPAPLIVGASLSVIAPTGDYHPSKPFNFGTNRWGFKPEVGISYSVKQKLYLDLYTGIWLFTPNTNFFTGGRTLSQEPIWSTQAHVSYVFAPGTWAAFDGTYYSGGSISVNSAPPEARQYNSRVGVTVALGLAPRQSLRINGSVGASVRFGQDFSTLGVAYQLLWF